MPTISIDFSFLNQIANANDPLTAAWLIFKAGGWIPFVVVIWKGLTCAWLEERS